MRLAADLVKGYLVPGSISFLVLSLAAGVALLYGGERVRRLGRAWLTLLAVLYWALGTWVVADWLVARLVQQHRSVTDTAEARGASTIVVLSVGSTVYSINGREVVELGEKTASNVLEASRVYRLLGQAWIVASGGPGNPSKSRTPDAELMRDSLVTLGVPADRVMLESRSANTREQAVFTAEVLRKKNVKAIVLVTTPEHMSRAAGAFESLGFSVVPSVSPLRTAARGSLWDRLRPTRGALLQSDSAVYEYLARTYYWLQGWL